MDTLYKILLAAHGLDPLEGGAQLGVCRRLAVQAHAFVVDM